MSSSTTFESIREMPRTIDVGWDGIPDLTLEEIDQPEKS
jgi:hypothetical protein